MNATTSLEQFKSSEFDTGKFQIRDISPNGCCRWCVFGRPADKGVKTGNGARRIFCALTPEIERILQFTYIPTHHVSREPY